MRVGTVVAAGPDAETGPHGRTQRCAGLDLPTIGRAELLEAVGACLDRLARPAENLLDISRSRSGPLRPRPQPVDACESLPRAIVDVPETAGGINHKSGDQIRPVLGGGPLLERAVASLVGNAVCRTDYPVTIAAPAADKKLLA